MKNHGATDEMSEGRSSKVCAVVCGAWCVELYMFVLCCVVLRCGVYVV